MLGINVTAADEIDVDGNDDSHDDGEKKQKEKKKKAKTKKIQWHAERAVIVNSDPCPLPCTTHLLTGK